MTLRQGCGSGNDPSGGNFVGTFGETKAGGSVSSRSSILAVGYHQYLALSRLTWKRWKISFSSPVSSVRLLSTLRSSSPTLNAMNRSKTAVSLLLPAYTDPSAFRAIAWLEAPFLSTDSAALSSDAQLKLKEDGCEV